MTEFGAQRGSLAGEVLERKGLLFSELVREAAACRVCPAMCGRRAVLSELNGALHARVMFIGEAPGRQGGDRTRVPFSGDQSGQNFTRFIASIGLAREQIFITNAVLCNPRRESGANRTPSRREMANCSDFLRRQVEIINPRVIVTMGRVSLEALRSIEYHQLNLKEAAGKVFEWGGRLLVPLYHPSPQVLASHRREAEQLRDYKAVRRALSYGLEKGNGVGRR
jgi:DNA polymerase